MSHITISPVSSTATYNKLLDGSLRPQGCLLVCAYKPPAQEISQI